MGWGEMTVRKREPVRAHGLSPRTTEATIDLDDLESIRLYCQARGRTDLVRKVERLQQRAQDAAHHS